MAHTGGSVGGDPLAMESKPDQILTGKDILSTCFMQLKIMGERLTAKTVLSDSDCLIGNED